jgi:hypothetical protein
MAFEATVPSRGSTLILSGHPQAPSLIMSRDPQQLAQIVPVLLACAPTGDEEASMSLGMALTRAGGHQLPLFQCITDRAGFHGIMAPYLFYRAPAAGSFSAAAATACREVSRAGLIADWCTVRCGISYLTKDGKCHRHEDYPLAFLEQHV